MVKLLAIPKHSKERRDSFGNLIRVGDFYCDTDVLSTKKDQLILVRRPTEDEAKFCPHYLRFMLKKHLWHHVKNSCIAKKKNDAYNNRYIIAQSNALLNDAFGSEIS